MVLFDVRGHNCPLNNATWQRAVSGCLANMDPRDKILKQQLSMGSLTICMDRRTGRSPVAMSTPPATSCVWINTIWITLRLGTVATFRTRATGARSLVITGLPSCTCLVSAVIQCWNLLILKSYVGFHLFPNTVVFVCVHCMCVCPSQYEQHSRRKRCALYIAFMCAYCMFPPHNVSVIVCSVFTVLACAMNCFVRTHIFDQLIIPDWRRTWLPDWPAPEPCWV